MQSDIVPDSRVQEAVYQKHPRQRAERRHRLRLGRHLLGVHLW